MNVRKMAKEMKREEKQRDSDTERNESRINLRTVLGILFTEIGKVSG